MSSFIKNVHFSLKYFFYCPQQFSYSNVNFIEDRSNQKFNILST